MTPRAYGAAPQLRRPPCPHPLLHGPGGRAQHLRELERDDELGGRAGTELLEGLEVLQSHRLLVDRASRVEDALERLAEALGVEDLRLTLAFGAQDGRLLLALGDVDVGLPRALRLGDHGAPRPLRRELAVHGLLDLARGRDLADLDGRDLAAPALGLLIELDAQDLVDLVAFGEDVVEQDVAHDRAQRGGGDAL